MNIDFSKLTPSQRYFAMVQSIIPRPIAWILSKSAPVPAAKPTPTADQPIAQTIEPKALLNLAPYSFFTGICSDPPLLVLSAGIKPEGPEKGREKDTRRNIREHGSFVVHISSTSSIDALNQSAATLEHTHSEIDELGLELCEFEGFSLPRLKDAKIALGCELYKLDEIGNTPQAVIYGEIKCMYVDDAIIEEHPSRLIISPEKLDPLARLGGNFYSSLGETLSAQRPK